MSDSIGQTTSLTTMRPLVTDILPDAVEVARDNLSYKGSLAVLYDITWREQRAENVFVRHSVVRDKPEEGVANVTVPEEITVLSWRVDGNVQVLLRTPFRSRGVLVRDEYRAMLKHIWGIFGAEGGAERGYVQNPDIGNAALFPPYNPFINIEFVPTEDDEAEIPGIVITGTPGIGKSMFLLFVLTQRLLARQTTVFMLKGNEFIIFDESGVYSSRETDAEFLFLPNNTWFLVDSNPDLLFPPTAFLDACASYSRKLIVSASPRAKHFSFITKYPDFEILWMEPFSLEECIVARSLQHAKTPLREQVLESFFRQYGPSARLAYLNAKTPEKHKTRIIENMCEVTWKKVQDTVANLSAGYFDTQFSHSVLIARPQRGDPTDFHVEFATNFLADLVLKTFMKKELQKGYQLYRYFLRSPKARASAGSLLEACAVNILPLGGQWRMYPMKRVAKRQSNQENQHWRNDPGAEPYTLLIGHQNHAVKILKGEPVDIPQAEFSQVARVDYESSPSSPQKEQGFYVPKADNEASFDAWIYEPRGKHCVILQATVKIRDHELKTQGLKWSGEDKIDVVILSDTDGGTDISTAFENVPRIRSVYRLVY